MDKDNVGKTIFCLWSLGYTEKLEYMGEKKKQGDKGKKGKQGKYVNQGKMRKIVKESLMELLK